MLLSIAPARREASKARLGRNEEHRRNQHSADRKVGISGILDAQARESGQPQEPQHSGPQGRRDRLPPATALRLAVTGG